MTAPRRRPADSRGAAVYAAWSRYYAAEVRRRFEGTPNRPPTPEELDGVIDVERQFITDLAADRIAGSVIGAIEARYGPIGDPGFGGARIETDAAPSLRLIRKEETNETD